MTFVIPMGDKPSLLGLSQVLANSVCWLQASVISFLTPAEVERLPSEL